MLFVTMQLSPLLSISLMKTQKNIQTRSNVAFTRILTIQSTVIINVKYNFFSYIHEQKEKITFFLWRESPISNESYKVNLQKWKEEKEIPSPPQ